MPNKIEDKEFTFPLEWSIPEDIVARYANNMLVQRTEIGFLISFFETKPPVLLGDPEEINEQIKKIKSVRSNCVSQIIVSANVMPRFIEALQSNLKKSMAPTDDKEK